MAQAVTNIGQVRALGTPAKQYLWEFVVPAIPGAVGAAAQSFSFRARSSAWPGRAITKSITHFKGHEILHPGKNKFPHIFPVTFEEGMNGIVVASLVNWFNLWLNEKDGSSVGEKAVKVDAMIRLLDHQQQVVLEGHIFGFFLEDLTEVPLAYEADGLLQIPAKFSYDFWDLD